MSTGSEARFAAISTVMQRQPVKIELNDENGRPQKISDYFGINTFADGQMHDKLPSPIYERIQECVRTGAKLDQEVAEAVAHAVKEWAIDRGVTHFCHWFQPQTGSTAEKHDAFLTFNGNNKALERFSGSQLIQSEPDASSFPSGGMRTTFEARGYTAWDPGVPMFIMEAVNTKTLCIPSVFVSYYGDALDEKTGLLRSIEVLSRKAIELLQLIGIDSVARVSPTLGTEQEYFLIDRAFWALRPDLVMAERTLVGAPPPRGQQLEDHYFGSIPSRVQAFLGEMEHELYKLGVPVKTRHNEVAPSQFETAPIFEEADIAVDHNHICMDTLRKVAKRHNFVCLLHEKPFAGINGSGKHSNWSMALSSSDPELDGDNLLDPGKTPHKNLRFLLCLAAVLRGVHKHAGLLRAGIASAGNDHRLGANEAPPAILSVFLGDQLSGILDEIEKGEPKGTAEQAVISLGIGTLPQLMRDNTDRNRTSPFAFTGNKFEFRAVGSSASVAFPITLLHAAVSDGFSELTTELKQRMDAGKSRDAAIWEVLRETVKQTKSVRFEGNNYADEWTKEAEQRGLPNYHKTPEALAQLVTPSSKEVLTRLAIFSESEVVSRYKVRLERYLKAMRIEADTLATVVDTQILPACYSYHASLAAAVASAKAAGVPSPQSDSLQAVSDLLDSLYSQRKKLEAQLIAATKAEHKSEEDAAHLFAGEVFTIMEGMRAACDSLEALVADNFWPLPKYREMLFLS